MRNKQGQFTKVPFRHSDFSGLRLLILTVAVGAIVSFLYAPVQEPVSPMGVPLAKAEEPVVETVVEAPETLKQEILHYIVSKFGDDAANAITLIRKCENSTFDQTRTNHNRNGSVDYGVFQVNDVHVKRYGQAFKTSWKANVDTAYEIYKAAGNSFTPWSCAHVIDQKPFYMKGSK